MGAGGKPHSRDLINDEVEDKPEQGREEYECPEESENEVILICHLWIKRFPATGEGGQRSRFRLQLVISFFNPSAPFQRIARGRRGGDAAEDTGDQSSDGGPGDKGQCSGWSLLRDPDYHGGGEGGKPLKREHERGDGRGTRGRG